MKRLRTLSMILLLPLLLWGQQLHEDYIEWGDRGTAFSTKYWDWIAGQPYSTDDNFFISRVRPKQRFRDALTQVNPELTEQDDKRLCMWMPIGTVPNNALPDGVFDRDVFSMWQYVTHLGNWTASLARVPGAITDVAHKNGVGVSATASIPYGELSTEWRTNLQNIIDIGVPQMADFLQYYGIDGLGYNSEFKTSNTKFMNSLMSWHQSLNSVMKKRNPLFEIIWYDGTNGYGTCTFDQGLNDHNVGTFGKGGAERSNLFLNYNWNTESLLQHTVEYAKSIGRNPLDLYCGFNLQGREPREGIRWPLLQQYPLSIGLWGAHNENMFYESRGERGYNPLVRQQTYLLRQEMWFTGGSRNPIDKKEVNNSLRYDTDNTDFFGMSALMSARSSLSWNLSDEPFVTSFSLGNGTAYYWHGEKTSAREWYNIGTQDYLPTWRWWFARRLLGRDKEDVPTGLDATFTWDDAWNGGSCLQIEGSDAGTQVLHLYKTLFTLQGNDRVSLIVKRTNGSARVWLVLTDADGTTERVEINQDEEQSDQWVVNDFSVSAHFPNMAGKTLRLIALEIEDADNLQLRLGHLAILRADHFQPFPPVIERTELLSHHAKGCDGKIIWQMPNDFFEDEVCYNIDVFTSLFHLHAQVEGNEPILMTATTSWAGILYNIPVPKEGGRVRLGVSAVALDMQKESEISWGEWEEVGAYEGEDDDDTTGGSDTNDENICAPQILSLSQDEEYPNSIHYTAVNSDGEFSRAISLDEHAFGVRCSDITQKCPSFFSNSFSVACWVRPENYFYATQLLNIRDKTDSWSRTEWGWFWHILTDKGRNSAFTLRGNSENQSYDIPSLQLHTGQWHHLVYAFDFDNSEKVSVRLYVDGKQLTESPTLALPLDETYTWRDNNVLAIGGNMFAAAGLNGKIDDFRLYDKALTATDAHHLAYGMECDTEPACLWDFERQNEADDTHDTVLFLSKGKYPDIPATLHRYVSGEKEGEGSFVSLTANDDVIGAPNAPGSTFTVTTTDQWQYDDTALVMTDSTNQHVAGSAIFNVAHDGYYDITLTRHNRWGTHSMTITDVNMTVAASIANVHTDNAKPAVIYDLQGRRLSSTPRQGVYLVNGKKKLLR